jgi:succinyl-diaminopimelate desuccinylase
MLNREQIYNEVDSLEEEKIMDIMKKLISIDTSIPPGNAYRQYVDVISPYFKNLGYKLEEVIVPEELVMQIPYPLEGIRINLVATKNFKQDKDISFYGHMDVVPAPEDGEEKWSFPPFEATMIEDGKIYGRGVADMKGAMASLILALQIIENLNLNPKYNIRVLNCTDEEISVYPGIRYLAEKNYIKGTIFCMETTIDPVIYQGFAGFLDVDVETIGKSCHSGMNYLGVNALEEMVPILVELMKLKRIVETRESKDIAGTHRSNTEESTNMRPMFNLDIIRAGEKSNIVPDRCLLTINRRFLPEENYDSVKQEILYAIEKGKEKSKALDVKVIFKYAFVPLKININGPNVQKMKRVIQEVQNITSEEFLIVGSSASLDMGIVSQILNTKDIIIHGVGNPSSNPHGVNESIELKDIKTFIKELIIFLCTDI